MTGLTSYSKPTAKFEHSMVYPLVRTTQENPLLLVSDNELQDVPSSGVSLPIASDSVSSSDNVILRLNVFTKLPVVVVVVVLLSVHDRKSPPVPGTISLKVVLVPTWSFLLCSVVTTLFWFLVVVEVTVNVGLLPLTTVEISSNPEQESP